MRTTFESVVSEATLFTDITTVSSALGSVIFHAQYPNIPGQTSTAAFPALAPLDDDSP